MKHLKEELLVSELEIYHDMQPIIDITNDRVLGYEFLLRTKNVKNPEVLFSNAMKENLLFDLDMKSVLKVFEMVQSQSDLFENIYLFINVFPSTLIEYDFYNRLLHALSATNIKPDSIVFEINESAKGIEMSAFKEAINKYKRQGFIISLDDIGKGDSNIKAILEIDPSIAKVDRYFSKDLANTPIKQEAIKHLLQLLGEKTTIVLEGIESKEDLEIAKKLGVPLVQGYYLGKPKPIEYYQFRSSSLPK